MFLIDDIVNAIGGAIGAGQQENQTNKALDLQKQIYGQNSQNYSPYLSAGNQSLGQLLHGLQTGGFNVQGNFNPQVNPQNLASDPGYQFRMQQAQQALERSAAARGGLNSGGFMKGLDQYSQGLASQEYGDAWNRQFQQGQADFGRQFANNQANYSNLAGIAGLGFNGANSLGSLGQNYANSMSSLYGAKGNAQAAGTMAITNGISGGIRDIGSLAGFL